LRLFKAGDVTGAGNYQCYSGATAAGSGFASVQSVIPPENATVLVEKGGEGVWGIA